MGQRYSLPIPYGWYGIAFSQDLAVGQVKPVHYFGRDMVVFRTESGEAKVLDAFCPHLGAHLGHGGKVDGESIACPFHGWQFNGAGQCTKVPYAKNMPPKVAGGKEALYAYPTVERNQVIWAWYHPERAEPSFEVKEIAEFYSDDWTPIERKDWIIGTTIQEAGENAVDAAHFIYVHGAVEMPKGDTTLDRHTRESVYDMKIPAMKEDGTIDMSGALRDSHLLAVSNGPGQTFQRFTGALETMMMGLATPIDQDHLQLHFVFTQPKSLSEGQKMMAFGVKAELINQVENDIPIWEHKVYLESPTLCDGDGPIHQYRKWFRQFYAEPAPTPVNVRAVG
jgi:phenylpropionate dioxygenase-like ring-hydroxylating dioxygenase large terminal subunit